MDFIELAKIVSKERLRKYYRFRWAKFYGGIATADCVGCCLRCIFCWSWDIVNHPETVGRFYSPEHVASELIKIARKHHGGQMRVSGNEPTLNRQHLLELLTHIPSHYRFILETNGILLGMDRTYCRDLGRFPNVHVRLSLKGCNGRQFALLTGMDESWFELQIKALENLLAEGVPCHPAVMVSFSEKGAVAGLIDRLSDIDPRLADIEEEDLILYPPVEDRLHRAGLM